MQQELNLIDNGFKSYKYTLLDIFYEQHKTDVKESQMTQVQQIQKSKK